MENPKEMMADLLDSPSDTKCETPRQRSIVLANGSIVQAPYKEKVAIMGFASSWVDTPFKDDSFEIWTLNEAYKLLEQEPKFKDIARFDRWFEIHDPLSPTKNKPEHVKFLSECPCPVYMREKVDNVKNCVLYPFDGILKYFPRRYLTNTIAEMTALAICEGFKEIHLYGVDMAAGDEYAWQRPNCEYYCGFAEGRGIKLFIPNKSPLLKANKIYGLETDNALSNAMKERNKELNKKLQEASKEIMALQDKLASVNAFVDNVKGAISENKQWLQNRVI
jgi:hypothetical protein